MTFTPTLIITLINILVSHITIILNFKYLFSVQFPLSDYLSTSSPPLTKQSLKVIQNFSTVDIQLLLKNLKQIKFP